MTEPVDSKAEQVAILRKGVEDWNRWREENPSVSPDLRGEDLSQAVLAGANLRHANLETAQFQGANLQGSDLYHASLNGADFGKADLREADLREARLQNASLHGADLRGADLQEAVLQDTDLHSAKFRDANLQNANLEKAKGFRYGQLGGANLTGAKLPEAVGKFEALANVEELSQSAKKLFVTMLGACVYSWLTIATTTDVRLITNSASSPLPVIQTAIPIVGFYVAAPLLILCLYLYFHFYMQRLWEGLAELPAFFPDGAALDKKAHPWLLNGLVRSHFTLLKKNRPALSGLQVRLASLLAWWVVPLTLFLFWWRYLFRHDLPITVFQITLLVFSIGAAIGLSHLAARTLSGAESSPFIWKKAYKDARTYKRVAVGAGLAIAFLLLLRVSRGAIEGGGSYFGADFTDADVSTKPEGWTGREQDLEVQVALVKGARLSNRNLRGARANRAFLVKADLAVADLRFANLIAANLQEANLGDANLQLTYLMGANLQGAQLAYAKLQGAILQSANLQGAILQSANLQGADLSGANLRGTDLPALLGNANLQGADLLGADLRYASGLTAFQVKQSANWESAIYNEKFLKELGRPLDHNATVFKKFPEIYDPDGRRKRR